jgi:hypothetical protein
MPNRDFDAARAAYTWKVEPVTFTLAGLSFTVMPDPSMGDIMDLHRAPEIPKNIEDLTDERAILLLSTFIKKMLKYEDREKFDRALYDVPRSQGLVLVEIAAYIAEASSGFPTRRLASSVTGQRGTGRAAKRGTAGPPTSIKRRRISG